MGDSGLPVLQLSAEPKTPQLTAHGRGFRHLQDQVRLFEDDAEVYGPMSLHAAAE